MEIEKGVPIPGKRSKYPFAQMEVGDSFIESVAKQVGIHSCARCFGIKISTRKMGDGTIRVWRVK